MKVCRNIIKRILEVLNQLTDADKDQEIPNTNLKMIKNKYEFQLLILDYLSVLCLELHSSKSTLLGMHFLIVNVTLISLQFYEIRYTDTLLNVTLKLTMC